MPALPQANKNLSLSLGSEGYGFYDLCFIHVLYSSLTLYSPSTGHLCSTLSFMVISTVRFDLYCNIARFTLPRRLHTIFFFDAQFIISRCRLPNTQNPSKKSWSFLVYLFFPFFLSFVGSIVHCSCSLVIGSLVEFHFTSPRWHPGSVMRLWLWLCYGYGYLVVIFFSSSPFFCSSCICFLDSTMTYALIYFHVSTNANAILYRKFITIGSVMFSSVPFMFIFMFMFIEGDDGWMVW